MSAPVKLLPQHLPIAHDRFANAMATVAALVPAPLLVLIADHLDAMKLERAMGDLCVTFHLNQGEIRSGTFDRRTEWKRHEPPEEQSPTRAKA